MSTLQQKIEAMEKIGAGAVADQALQKLIRLHMQKYEQHLAEVRRELEPFEAQYGMASAEGHDALWRGRWETVLTSWNGWGSMMMCCCTKTVSPPYKPQLRHD
jgi:hypothetical protein